MLHRLHRRNKFLVVAVVVLFVAAMFGSLLYVAFSTALPDEIPGCPFNSLQEPVCMMSATDHLSAWKSVFLAIISPFVLFIAVIAAGLVVIASIILRSFSQFVATCVFLGRTAWIRRYTFPQRQLQEMFSQGILHPKLF